VRQVQKYLSSLPHARFFKIVGGDSPFQETGIPDLVGVYRGRFVGLEAKTPGGHVSPKQRRVLDEIEKAGGRTLVFTTVEEVISFLANIKDRR
jgi:VRR-NUC domain